MPRHRWLLCHRKYRINLFKLLLLFIAHPLMDKPHMAPNTHETMYTKKVSFSVEHVRVFGVSNKCKRILRLHFIIIKQIDSIDKMKKKITKLRTGYHKFGVSVFLPFPLSFSIHRYEYIFESIAEKSGVKKLLKTQCVRDKRLPIVMSENHWERFGWQNVRKIYKIWWVHRSHMWMEGKIYYQPLT